MYVTIETNIHDGKSLIDSICLLGGELSILETKGQNVDAAKKYLSRIDDIIQPMWDEIIKKQMQLNNLTTIQTK